MTFRRILPSILFVCCVSGASNLFAHEIGKHMSQAALSFLNSLDDEQKKAVTFKFDDAERKNWQFIPMERKGLPLTKMKSYQQHYAMALLQSALSHQGYSTSLNVMCLEQILHEMENNSPRRNPALYHVFIFGEPSNEKTWGWRFEGHHLSLSFTLVDGKTIVSTPSFFGSNPAVVKQGPHKGLRVLDLEEKLGRQLVRQLSPEQREVAIFSDTAPADVINGPGRDANPLDPKGVAAKDMTEKQKKLLMRLIKSYINKLRFPLAKEDLAKIEKAGIDNIHFAWAGPIKRGEGHYYRVQGPTFMLEYDCTQNDANHIHCVWRDFTNDLGEDLLKKHYETSKH